MGSGDLSPFLIFCLLNRNPLFSLPPSSLTILLFGSSREKRTLHPLLIITIVFSAPLDVVRRPAARSAVPRPLANQTNMDLPPLTPLDLLSRHRRPLRRHSRV